MPATFFNPSLRQRYEPLPCVEMVLEGVPTRDDDEHSILRFTLRMLQDAPLQYLAVVEMLLKSPPAGTHELARRYDTTIGNIRVAKLRGIRRCRSQLGWSFYDLVDRVRAQDAN